MEQKSNIDFILDSHFENNWVKPVFILDIDGTINPFLAHRTLQADPELIPGVREVNLRILTDEPLANQSVFINPPMLNKYFDLLSIITQPLWGSAWAEQSNLILAALHRGERWPFIDFPATIGFGFDYDTWKLPIVKDYVEKHYPKNTPIIWVDDELEADAFEWIEAHGGLAIKPNRYIGLREEDWQTIASFAKAFNPSE